MADDLSKEAGLLAKEDQGEHHSLALLAEDGSVWVAVYIRWWMVVRWLTWTLIISRDRKGWAFLKNKKGAKVRCRVVRVAKQQVRVRGIPSEES